MSIAIVGGGAGGIFAAIAAKERSPEAEVHLLERNPRIGIKIRISGGGKCNITHVGAVANLLQEGFREKNEQRFLRHALHSYPNSKVLSLLEEYGVPWHARENGRVFPDSGRADDVLGAFESALRDHGVTMHTNARVTKITNGKSRWSLETEDALFEATALVLATGGTSYRKVGTTGDGLRFAEAIGHAIVPIRAALAPIYLEQDPDQELVGIALRSVRLMALRESQTIATYDGDVLITHRGLSGPAVLGISRHAALALEDGAIQLSVNLLCRPADKVLDELKQFQQERSQQQVKTWLEEVLPNRFVPYVLHQARTPLDRKWHALTREERSRLSDVLTCFGFGRVKEIPIDRGEVTAGGIDLKEIDPRTMMSRIVPGLFFAGEMLDVAGEIGGYNLQAAYSTGWVAGSSAADFSGLK